MESHTKKEEKMKRNGKYLILPSIQGLGVAVIFWMTAVHVPEDTRIPLAQVGLIRLQVVLFMIIGRMDLYYYPVTLSI